MDFHYAPYDDSYKTRWDEFVSANPHAWPGHDSSVLEFERLRGLESHSHLALDEQGRVVAVAPMFLGHFKMARFIRFRQLTTGSSLRSGPLLDAALPAKARQRFWPEWAAWLTSLARRVHADHIRVALPHIYGDRPNFEVYDHFPLLDHGFKASAKLSMMLDFSNCPPDLLQQYESECRNMVRRAERGGAHFEHIQDREAWMQCYAMNLETFHTPGIPPYSRETLAWIWDGFVSKGLAHVFGVRHEGALIAVAVLVGTPHSQYYWIGFNRRPMALPGAGNFLQYHAMRWARERGGRFYEVGSLEFDGDRQRRVSRFKQSFGGYVVHGMQGTLVSNPLKMASAQWLQALAATLRPRRAAEGSAE